MVDKPNLPLSWSGWMRGDWFASAAEAPARDAAKAMQHFVGSVTPSTDLGSLSPPMLIEQLIELVRDRLVGRTITLSTNAGPVHVVPERVDARPSSVGLAVGQLGDIEVAATDVRWDRGHVDRAELRFRNVHIKPGNRPAIVAAPVEVTFTAQAETVARLVADRRPNLTVELGTEGVARVGLARHRRVGQVEVAPQLAGDHVRLVVTGAHLAGRRIGLGRGVPTASIPVPPFPSGLRIHDVVVQGSSVVVSGMIPELSRPLSLSSLRKLQRRIREGEDHYDLAPTD